MKNIAKVSKVKRYDFEISEDDMPKYVALASGINTNDLSSVQAYGQELTSVIASNGNALLQSVRADKSNEVIELTNELLGQLDMIDIDELNSNTKWKRFLRNIPFVGKLVTSVTTIMTKYDKISDNVDKITKKIDSTKIVAMRDNTTLQTIFDNNRTYIDQIRELITAAKLKCAEIDKQITDMEEHPENYEAYELNDLTSFQNALQKRIADMETTEYVLNQNLLQIRATQGNNVAIANKSDNIVNNVIPLWKNQLAIAIIMNNQKNSIDAQQKIADTTNKIMKKNAENLKINSINVAKANEEQVISLETLKSTTDDLISTIREVQHIHEDGARNREQLEQTLKSFTENIEQVMQEIR